MTALSEDQAISVPTPLTVADTRRTLANSIVTGTIAHDWVRVHGTIVATLQTSHVDDALANVFSPALRQVELARDHAERLQLATAIHGHLVRLLRHEPM